MAGERDEEADDSEASDRSLSIGIEIKKEATPLVHPGRVVRYSLGAASFRHSAVLIRTAQMTGAAVSPPRILVLVANTRDITRKVCTSGHCRSLPLAARQEETKTNFAGRDAVVTSSELRYVEQIREGEESSAVAELKKALKQIFVNKSFASRFEIINFHKGNLSV